MLTGVLNSLMFVVNFFFRFLWMVLGLIYVTAKIENRKEKGLWWEEGSLTEYWIVLAVKGI